MAQTMLLDGVTVSGASSNTFTVSDSYVTVMREDFTENDECLIEKQDIAGTGWLPYAPEGQALYLTYKVAELNILGKGVYRVNLQNVPQAAVTVASEV